MTSGVLPRTARRPSCDEPQDALGKERAGAAAAGGGLVASAPPAARCWGPARPRHRGRGSH
eukprot:5279283-Alexandrium_andersonii.AAC.1